MKKVTLKRLVLENWRAQNREAILTDKTIVRGANGTGKSTLTDAFFWLLTGVDARNRSNYDLYDNTKDFTYENAIPAVVEGFFEVNGIEHSLKRSAKQKWFRPRGKSEYVKDKSDEYTYYVDGLAVSAKVFKETVEDWFADIEKLKLMLNVRYYQMLDWKELRKHFADMVGVITDDELKGDYSSIVDLLEKYGSTDRVKEKLRQEINPLKDSVERKESEIKGMNEMLPTLEGVAEAEADIVSARNRIADIDAEITGIGAANNPLKEKRKAELAAIEQKETDIQRALLEWERTQNAPILEIKMKLEHLDKENARIQADNIAKKRQADSISTQIETAKQQYAYFDAERTKLQEAKKRALSKVFLENQECPNCGQPLPFDKVEELRKQFNADRDKEVASIIERGQQVRAMRDRQEELAKELEKQLQGIRMEQILDRTGLETELVYAEANKLPFDDSQLRAELEDMRSNLTVIPDVDVTQLVEEKKQLNERIRELQAVVARKDLREQGLRQIEVKEREKFQTSVKLAKLEGLFDKCVEREREWASIVRDRANKYLTYCKVEMIEFNKGGELKDVCSVTIDGVDVGVANTAKQIIAGIDIAEAFQKNANLELPIFIDNAEQICNANIPAVSNQLVLAYVDENSPKLTIG